MPHSARLRHAAARSLLSVAVLLLAACDHEGSYTCLRHSADVGMACGVELDCVDGAHCIAGVCAADAEHGEACSELGARCVDGYVCAAGRCVGTRAGEGEACSPDALDACAEGLRCGPYGTRHVCFAALGPSEPCVTDAQCSGESRCVADDEGASRCLPAPGEMEACSVDGGCADGLVCVEDRAGDARCRPAPTEPGDACAPGSCPTDMVCADLDRGPACVRLRLLGGACGESSRPEEQCVADAYCSPDTGRCEPRVAVGEVCARSLSGDAPGACADPQAVCQVVPEEGLRRCLPPAMDGESCAEGQVCGTSLYCDRDRAGPRGWGPLTPTR